MHRKMHMYVFVKKKEKKTKRSLHTQNCHAQLHTLPFGIFHEEPRHLTSSKMLISIFPYISSQIKHRQYTHSQTQVSPLSGTTTITTTTNKNKNTTNSNTITTTITNNKSFTTTTINSNNININNTTTYNKTHQQKQYYHYQQLQQ